MLSALEGLKLVAPSFEAYVLPGALAILIALFAVQSRGTGKVAAFFGPLTLLWFVTMAGLGLLHIADDWEVLLAFNPYYGVSFLVTHPGTAFAILGSVCLAVTGAEALYADLGHFGRKPIRMAWGTVVFPALALNYLGQGALVLSNPEPIANPFFLLAPALAASAAGDPRDARDHRREPGRDHRRLLPDPAGDPARPPAAPGSPLHLGDATRGRSTCRA